MDGTRLLSELDEIAEAYKKRGHGMCDLRDMNPKTMRRTLRDFVGNCSTFDADLTEMNRESRKRFCKSNTDGKISTRMRQLNLKQSQNGSGESKNRNSPESVETEESLDCEDNVDDFAISVARASLHLRDLIFRRESGAFTESKSSGSSQAGFGRVDSSAFLGLADVDIAKGKLSQFHSFSDLYGSNSSLTDFLTSGSGSGTSTSMTKTPSSISLKSFSGSGGDFSDDAQGRYRTDSKSFDGAGEAGRAGVADKEDMDSYFVADFEGGSEGDSSQSDSKDSGSHKSHARSPESSSTVSSNKRRRRSSKK